MNDSPFLPQGSGSRRARARARRSRRRRRLLTVGAIAIVVAAAAAIVVLSRSSVTHGSASASGKTTRRHHARATGRGPHATSPGSPAGLQLGDPPLELDLTGEHPVQVAFHHPPRAGLLFNLDDGRVLWQLDPLAHLHIASLTKMMTALRVVRAGAPDERVLVTKQAVDSAGSKVGVLPLGHHVRLETMLYGLLLPSGNDAAVALAQHASGSLGKFVDGMNAEAARLGMGCTHYTSPSGYVNARNYSCAADLAELAHVDLEQPLIAHIVRTEKAILPFPIKGGKLYLYNNNPLLVYGYPGATGLKTGYTELAGDCLVGTAERDGVRLGVVLLHSPELGRQAERLLDEGFEQAYHQGARPERPIPPGR
jgi:serine-type D-Ala-D-Ala carboxypeptidase (penicillin-binding protein 5/6)